MRFASDLRRVQLVALNLDGVLLDDSFGPVIHRFVVERGLTWSPRAEQVVLSQSPSGAVEALGLGGSPTDVVGEFFQMREAWVREHPVRVAGGVGALLGRLRALGVHVVCYGGLGRQHFDRYLSGFAGLFDGPGYVCTADFRPGLREIAEEVFSVGGEHVLFIDDVARVAEAARGLGAAFIGHPSSSEHSFQRELMLRAGVRHMVDSLGEIDGRLLRRVDEEAADGRLWPASTASTAGCADVPVPPKTTSDTAPPDSPGVKGLSAVAGTAGC